MFRRLCTESARAFRSTSPRLRLFGGARHYQRISIVRLLIHYWRNSTNYSGECPLRLPDLKLVITGTKYGYRRDDGVLVVPIGCLME